MTRIETLRRSTAEAHAQRLAPLAAQMQQLQQMSATVGTDIRALEAAQTSSAEDLARRFLPLAESMAALSEETRRTLTMIAERTGAIAKRCAAESRTATAAAQDAADRARQTSGRLNDQLARLSATMDELRRQPSPWPPAVATMAVIVAAVVWLAWRAQVL